MADYLFLIMGMIGMAGLSVFAAFYNRKNAALTGVSRLYTLLVVTAAFLSWCVLYALDFSFEPRVLFYSLFYGIGYATAMLGIIGALGSGSVALTAFVKQFSFVFVSIWGYFFFPNEHFTWQAGVGIAAIALSMFLCLVSGKNRKTGEGTPAVSLRWLLFAGMLLGGNVLCSLLQKYQQMAYPGEHKSMMMVFGVGFAVIVAALFTLKEDKTHWRTAVKTSFGFPLMAGACSGILNLAILLLATSVTLSSGFVFSGMAVGGLVITMLCDVLVFGERLSLRQWVGMVLGTGALVFLNI
jgi:drug/metabolite transporter (DMT)-like permease